jgi:hypothetical protein
MRVRRPRDVVGPGKDLPNVSSYDRSIVEIANKSCKFQYCVSDALWSNKNSWDEPARVFVAPSLSLPGQVIFATAESSMVPRHLSDEFYKLLERYAVSYGNGIQKACPEADMHELSLK